MIDMDGFEQIVTVEPGYDKRADGYGIGAARIRFVLRGPRGAVQFLIGTGWYPGSAREHLLTFDHTYEEQSIADQMRPDGWDVGYHSRQPVHEDQPSMECDLLPEGCCYYDGSGLRADTWIESFITGGTDWLWPKLREFYAEMFEQPGYRVMQGTDL